MKIHTVPWVSTVFLSRKHWTRPFTMFLIQKNFFSPEDSPCLQSQQWYRTTLGPGHAPSQLLKNWPCPGYNQDNNTHLNSTPLSMTQTLRSWRENCQGMWLACGPSLPSAWISAKVPNIWMYIEKEVTHLCSYYLWKQRHRCCQTLISVSCRQNNYFLKATESGGTQ